MGLFDFWNKRNKNVLPQVGFMSPFEWQNLISQDDTYIPLNKHPDVVIAVDKIADLVSNMTIHLMENSDKGDVRVRDELSRKIDINPYKYMTRKTWVSRIVRDLLLNGDGNAVVHVKLISGTDFIGDLMPLNMRSVEFIDEEDGGYYIRYGSVRLNPDEVVHFTINPDEQRPHIGTGYKALLRDIVKNLTQANKTKNSFMRNKNIPSVIVSVNGDADGLTNQQGREAIMNSYLNTTNAGEPWIIPAEMMRVDQVKPLTLKDIAINESVEIDKKTIAGLFGVPAFFLGVGEFNKEEYNTFINTRILSIAEIIAQTLTRDLLISPRRYFKFNPRSLYSYNITELVSAGSQMVQLAAMRRNELRDWIGLVPDPEMEDIIVLENYLHQDDLDKQKKLKGGENDE